MAKRAYILPIVLALFLAMTGCSYSYSEQVLPDPIEDAIDEPVQTSEPLDYEAATPEDAFVVTFGEVKWRGRVLSMGVRAGIEPNALFIKSLTPFWGDDVGQNFVMRTGHDTVFLDADGAEITLGDIPVGAIVDLVSSSALFMSKPPIGGASFVQIVE